MSNNEQFRTRIMTGLAEIMPTEQLAKVLRIFDEISAEYEIHRIGTEIITTDGIPNLVKSYIASKAVENRSKGTLKEYTSILAAFFREVKKNVRDITTNDLRIYMYRYKERRHVKDGRIESIRVVLNGFFEWLVDEGELDKNPARRIDVIKTPKTERQPMSLLELERMRAACRTIREKALIDFLYSTGCRVSEVASMKIEDVDFPEGTVHIRHGKGDKERKVYINAESEVSLRAYMEERQDETPYLFVASRRPYGGMGIKSFQSIIKKVAGRTNITKRVTPHIFRHTTGTVAIQHGMPVEQVKEMLGHESLETTMIYAKVDNRQVKANHQRCVV